MNLPNKLTTSRFAFALLLLLCLTFSFPGSKTLALLLFLVATATDWLDGYLARTKYGVTAFGKLMDPLADKVLVTVALVSFVEIRFDPGHPESPLVPALLVVPILFREFMVTGLRLLAVEQGIVLSAGTLGKWKTALQMTAIMFTLFSLALVYDWLPEVSSTTLTSIHFTLHWLIWGLMAGATVITLVSGWDYFSKNRALFTPLTDENA
jgi:CDP-diacylglycerol--glycerol-3-phosphate 3-phosphatidyltransferase